MTSPSCTKKRKVTDLGDEGLLTEKTQPSLPDIVRNYSRYYKDADPQMRGAIVETAMLVMKTLAGPDRTAFLSFDVGSGAYREAHPSLILKRIDRMFVREIGLSEDVDYSFCWSHPSAKNPSHPEHPHVIFPKDYKPPVRRVPK
jgi:hypothetical protein